MLDYGELGQSRLTGFFDKSTKLQNLIKAILDPYTELEAVADTLKTDRWIDSAIGKQLDGIGDIVVEPRNGRDDETYRMALRFRIFVNVSRGTPSDMIQGLKVLTAPTDCQYLEVYPATALLFTNGFFVDSSTAVAMADLAPVAVKTSLLVSFADKPFRFGRTPLPGELFVNGGNSYLTAQGSDIQVTNTLGKTSGATLGGVVPAELDVGLGYLDVGGGSTLAVYDPNHLHTLGHYNLTGVFDT